jgi:hypothetical protein
MRQFLEARFQERQRTTLETKHSALSVRMQEMAERRVHGAYDAAQPDKIGVTLARPDFWIPDANSGYVWLHLGGAEGHEDHNSPDWHLARELLAEQRTYRDTQAAELILKRLPLRSVEQPPGAY